MQPHHIFKALLCCIIAVALKLFQALSTSDSLRCPDKSFFCPHLTDFSFSLFYAAGFILVKYILSWITVPLGNYLISSRKCDHLSQRQQKHNSVKVAKFSHHLFRFFYYLIVTLWGFNILQPEPYFPVELGGTYVPSSTHDYIQTYLMDTMDKLSPRALEFIPWYFRITLAFQLASSFLVMRNPYLSDHPEATVQFVLNIILVVSGYMANHLFLGACLLLMHDCCDILTSWCQTLVNTRYKATTFLCAVSLIVSFAYMRLFCFGKLFLVPIVYAIESEKLYVSDSSSMIYFGALLLCLCLMNIYWFSLLVKSCFVYVMYGRITDGVA